MILLTTVRSLILCYSMTENRIDLTLIPIEDFVNDFPKDSQSILLLDKDGLTEVYPPANDSDYLHKETFGTLLQLLLQ